MNYRAGVRPDMGDIYFQAQRSVLDVVCNVTQYVITCKKMFHCDIVKILYIYIKHIF